VSTLQVIARALVYISHFVSFYSAAGVHEAGRALALGSVRLLPVGDLVVHVPTPSRRIRVAVRVAATAVLQILLPDLLEAR
jgi:hypothetical protein